MNQELLQLLNALKTAEGLSLASVAKEVKDLKDDQADVKKDLEKVLMQIVDKVDSIPLNEEIGKVNDKLRSEVTKLEDKLSKTGEALTSTEKKTLNKIQTLISDLREELESKLNDKSFLDEIKTKLEENSFDKFLKGIKEVKLETGDIKGLGEFVVSQIPKSRDYSPEIADLRNTVASIGTKNYVPAGVEIFHNGQNFGRIPSINFIGGTLNASASRVDVNLGSGGSGSSTFLGLTDTPSAYTGEALKVVRVNAGETGLEFVTLAGGGDMLTSTYDPANIAEQLVGLNATQTLANKTLTTPTIGQINSVVSGANATSGFNANVTGNHQIDIDNTNTGGSTTITLNFKQGGNNRFNIQYSRATLDTTFSTNSASSDLVFSPNSTEVLRVAPSGLTVTGTLNTHTIPGGTGTLALTSNIPTALSQLSNDTGFLSGSGLANEVVFFDPTGTSLISGVNMYVNGADIELVDNNNAIVNKGDPTKRVKFESGSVTTATTRTKTFQDTNGTLAELGNKLSAFASTTSAELAGVISDETGTGALVFADTPTFATRINTPVVRATSSGGLLLEASNGTDIGLLGAGNTANVTWYGSHNFDTATQDTIAGFIGSGKTLSSLSTSTYPSLTELSYVKGVTSAIQTQLNAKAGTSQVFDWNPLLYGTVADGDYKIIINCSFGGTINETTTESTAGTGTFTFKINTTALGGTANSVSTTEQTQTHSSANTFVAGDNIVITCSSASALANVSVKIKYTRTFA